MAKVAAVQCPVVFADPEANAAACIRRLEALAAAGVDLAVFPEAALTGYCVSSASDALGIAIPRRHGALESIRAACDRLDLMAVVGYAEQDGEHAFNAAALFEPGHEPRHYRKTHLPELGFDRFAGRGDALPVFETRIGKIGVLICFDLRYPEATRTLALRGAQIICLPTNWPEGAETSADIICRARAAENGVYFVTANRMGEENGFRFIGRSKIIGTGGEILAGAEAGEAVLTVEIDLSKADEKHKVVIPGAYEYDVMLKRRPELYEPALRDA